MYCKIFDENENKLTGKHCKECSDNVYWRLVELGFIIILDIEKFPIIKNEDIIKNFKIKYKNCICNTCKFVIQRYNLRFCEILQYYILSSYITNVFTNLEHERVNTKILDRKLNVFKATRRFLDRRDLVDNNSKNTKNYNGLKFNYEKNVQLDFLWCNRWKGDLYYKYNMHEKYIFNIDGNDFFENYKLRKNSNLNDSICGHPFASHGWYYDSLKELENLNIILN